MSLTVEWWTVQQGIWLGAGGGSAIGVLGGALGAALGVCAPKGVGRTFVLPASGGLSLLGWLLLAAGVVAAANSQPYHVVYPLALGGSILAGIGPMVLAMAVMAYGLAEARRQTPDAPDIAPPGQWSPMAGRVIVHLWAPSGPLGRWMPIAGWALLVCAGLSLVSAAWLWQRGGAFHAWWPWAMVTFGLGCGGVVSVGMARAMNRQVLRVRTGLEATRLAAEEIRRG